MTRAGVTVPSEGDQVWVQKRNAAPYLCDVVRYAVTDGRGRWTRPNYDEHLLVPTDRSSLVRYGALVVTAEMIRRRPEWGDAWFLDLTEGG